MRAQKVLWIWGVAVAVAFGFWAMVMRDERAHVPTDEVAQRASTDARTPADATPAADTPLAEVEPLREPEVAPTPDEPPPAPAELTEAEQEGALLLERAETIPSVAVLLRNAYINPKRKQLDDGAVNAIAEVVRASNEQLFAARKDRDAALKAAVEAKFTRKEYVDLKSIDQRQHAGAVFTQRTTPQGSSTVMVRPDEMPSVIDLETVMARIRADCLRSIRERVAKLD